MKGRADGMKRCDSFSVQKVSEKSSEALWPPELRLPGSRGAGRGPHAGSACSVHGPPPVPSHSPSPSPKANEQSWPQEDKSFCLYETKSHKLLTTA